MNDSSLGSPKRVLPRRALIFLFYDAQGFCDESVLNTLRGFRPFVEHLLVVSNGELQTDSRSALSEVANEILERENTGFDVGAYRAAFQHVGWGRAATYDEILLVNYTFFGPITTFGDLFERMDKESADFWGITNHPAVTPHPFTGKGTMSEHLQSYWLTLRKALVAHPSFRDYWESLELPHTYSDVVTQFETQFTAHFEKLGFTWKAAFPAQNYGVLNPTMQAALALLDDGCPLFKKRLYFHDMPAQAAEGVTPAEVTRRVSEAGFPENLIVKGVCRRATSRELNLGLNATFVAPKRAQDAGTAQDEHQSDVSFVKTVVVSGRPWKSLAQGDPQTYLGDAEIVIVDVPGPAHDRRGDRIVTGFENARTAITKNVPFIAQTFNDHALMGALFPLTQVLSHPMTGRHWHKRTQNAALVAEALQLPGPFSHTSVLGPYRGIAAYRRHVLERAATLINEVGWDELTNLAGGEPALERILDLLTGDIAKEVGMFVGQAASADELRLSAPLMLDIHSRKPKIYPDYVDYPYAGRIISPSLKNRFGQMIKDFSPSTFDQLHSVEQQLRNAVSGMRRRK